MREKYVSKKNMSKKARQKETLELLAAFNDKLSKANVAPRAQVKKPKSNNSQAYIGGIGENLMEDQGFEGETEDSWMCTKLKFKKHIDDRFRLSEKELASSDVQVIDSKTEQGRREFKQLESL
mmetsp:Transcript_8060/g.14778  ORF Transcript_8060/g.14778 Transcript_8060/m.14778 type:complete len:123 (+) Transcript_8060:268-636(+)